MIIEICSNSDRRKYCQRLPERENAVKTALTSQTLARVLSVALIPVMLVLNTQVGQAQSQECDDCADVLQFGVFEETRSSDCSDYLQHLEEWLNQASYDEINKKVNAGLDVTVLLANTPLNLGGTFSRDEERVFQAARNQGKKLTIKERNCSELYQKSASSTVVDAWLRCRLSRAERRFGFWYTPMILTSDEFNLEVHWAPPFKTQTNPTPTLSLANCSYRGVKPRDKEIPFGGSQLLQLKRDDERRPAAVTISAEGIAGAPTLEYLVPPSVPRFNPSTATFTFPRGYTVQISLLRGPLSISSVGAVISSSTPEFIDAWPAIGSPPGQFERRAVSGGRQQIDVEYNMMSRSLLKAADVKLPEASMGMTYELTVLQLHSQHHDNYRVTEDRQQLQVLNADLGGVSGEVTLRAPNSQCQIRVAWQAP